MLLSLKAGGVGLNLTAANHLLLLDPAWNPASEWQCFDRTHRRMWTVAQAMARLSGLRHTTQRTLHAI